MTLYQLRNLTSWHGGQFSAVYALASILRYNVSTQHVRVDRKFWEANQETVRLALLELTSLHQPASMHKGHRQSLTRAINFLRSKQL